MTEKDLCAEDLRASGCSKEQIEAYASCRCKAEKLRFLQQQREKLLDSIHEQEQQISNLDYLTHKMNGPEEKEDRK